MELQVIEAYAYRITPRAQRQAPDGSVRFGPFKRHPRLLLSSPCEAGLLATEPEKCMHMAINVATAEGRG
jgi:hypothetical protein